MVTALLIDSSIWIAYLRRSDAVQSAVVDAIDNGAVRMCEPIALELLSGLQPTALEKVERLVDAIPGLALLPDADFRSAARIMRRVRRNGHTVRSSMDALIAAVAIRHDVTLVHDDIDFERIAAVTALRQERWPRTVAS